MTPAQSKRQSRKRRRSGKAPRAVATAPRHVSAERAPRRPGGAVDELSAILTGRTYGERPPSLFAPIPVSEIAIFAGGVGAVVCWLSHSSASLIVGIVVCALGVLEVTLREHLSGYRSHAMLLAAIPAVGILIVSVAVLGTPRHRSTRELLLGAAVPVFAVLFWLLRKRFLAARQARVIRPPGA